MNRRDLLSGAVILFVAKNKKEIPATFLRMYEVQNKYTLPIVGIPGNIFTCLNHIYCVDNRNNKRFELKCSDGEKANNSCEESQFYNFNCNLTLKILNSQIANEDDFKFVIDEGFIKAVPKS